MDVSLLNGDHSTLNLSGQGLIKLAKGHHSSEEASKVTCLILDSNELQRLDNIDGFPSLVELSARHNHLVRMFSVNKLNHLVRLDLSNNKIHSIEGLKDLEQLKWLNLSGNNIKTIEHLHKNILLEYLALSENGIALISNLSHLTKLKQLFLHKNHIGGLKHCELYLPKSIVTLTLAHNNLVDLNEISHLVQLEGLREFSISGNPCVTMSGSEIGFDYRPFLINWCMGLKVIDGYAVDDIERLKGEWLYSHGRGRQFRLGEQGALVQYLAECCPLNSLHLETEQEKKLRLILSKAHQHQQQLKQEQLKKNKDTRGSVRSKIPKPQLQQENDLMTRSLDPSLLDSCTMHVKDQEDIRSCMHQAQMSLTQSLHGPESLTNIPYRPTDRPAVSGSPLPAATKLVPVPESLISPSVGAPPIVPTVIPSKTGISKEKLQMIKTKAQEKRDKKTDKETDKAATCIQKVWRGYRTRTLNQKVLSVYQHIQTLRTNQFIKKLSADMEATRAALDCEHKLQLIQMEAINALWKKVVSLQPVRNDEGMNDVKELAETCTRLNNQVQQLQESMQEVLRCVSPSVCSSTQTSTQTEITAVHTPQEDRFLYQKSTATCSTGGRPSTLPLPPVQLTHYADSLVDGVIKTTVAQQEEDNEEITP
uniref:Centrosomal protein of 97 kDa n=1 Tax=Clastoptera arizonana TaxID=38151 RepID=A0A1B6DTC1_9HEMI